MAKKEIILAAGAIHSPKILELSAIGTKSLLESKGIEVVVDNQAVGENFHDHPNESPDVEFFYMS
jgi:choline dehydrogenase-like flavoprotein